MTAKHETSTGAANKFDSLLAWWSAPQGLGNIEERGKRFQEFAIDLQKATAEEAAHEIEAMFSTREQLISSIKGLIQSKGPEETIAAQAAIFEAYFNGLAERAKRWAVFAEKTHAYCSELAREATAQKKVEEKPRAAQGREAPRQAAE